MLLGALVIGPALLLGRGIPTLRAWEERELARVEELHREVDRATQLMAAIRGQADGDSVPSRSSERAGWFVRSLTVAPAVAEVTEYLTGVARASFVDLRSTTVRGDTTFVAGSARLEFRMSLVTDTQGLLAFLRELAVGPRLLPVRSIAIAQSNPAAAASEPERLTVELVIESYAVRGTPAP